MESYLVEKKKLYTFILEFLENYDENSEEISKKYLLLYEFTQDLNIEKDSEEMKQFLLIIKSISDYHHRDLNFIENIYKILQHYKTQIKQTLSNIEIFHIFESNKKIILFLLKNDIIRITEPIFNEMICKYEPNGNRYCHFFYPELENFIGEEQMKEVKKDLLTEDPNIFEHFDEKRQEGENDSYICSLIRQDLIEEFIVYMNRKNYSLSSQITQSIFETNSFLIENKNITLIEYSAFFGSIQVFQFLLMNNVELTPSLWLYTIHSKNAELIHLLESNEVLPPKFSKKDDNSNNYLTCFIESIKCHHNNIADYIEYNLLSKDENDSEQKEEIISNCIKYHNYSHFKINSIIDHGFFYLQFYHYDKLVNFLLEEKQKEINLKMIKNNIF